MCIDKFFRIYSLNILFMSIRFITCIKSEKKLQSFNLLFTLKLYSFIFCIIKIVILIVNINNNILE